MCDGCESFNWQWNKNTTFWSQNIFWYKLQELHRAFKAGWKTFFPHEIQYQGAPSHCLDKQCVPAWHHNLSLLVFYGEKTLLFATQIFVGRQVARQFARLDTVPWGMMSIREVKQLILVRIHTGLDKLQDNSQIGKWAICFIWPWDELWPFSKVVHWERNY